MDTLRIYKYSLALPLVVSGIAALLLYASVEIFTGTRTFEQINSGRDGINLLLLIIAASGVTGGIPYLILAGLVLREMKEMNEHQVRTSLVWLPVLMIVFYGVVLAIYAPFADGLSLAAVYRFFTQWLALSAATLIFGYAYVLLCFGIVRGLRKRWPIWKQ